MDFLVDSIDEQGLILGRNGDTDIPVGTIFTKVTKSKAQGDIQNMETIHIGEIGQIKLELVNVHWYRKEINHVPRGHTAGLEVKGNGQSLLSKALNECNEKEYIHIQA